MIDMPMGQQRFFKRQTFIRDNGEQAVYVAPGIDQRGFARFWTPQQGTILLKRSNRNDAVLQQGSLLT
jgi:hypothetical protein